MAKRPSKRTNESRTQAADPASGKPAMVQVGFRLPQQLLWDFEDFVTNQKRTGGDYTTQGAAAEEAITRFLIDEGWLEEG